MLSSKTKKEMLMFLRTAGSGFMSMLYTVLQATMVQPALPRIRVRLGVLWSEDKHKELHKQFIESMNMNDV